MPNQKTNDAIKILAGVLPEHVHVCMPRRFLLDFSNYFNQRSNQICSDLRVHLRPSHIISAQEHIFALTHTIEDVPKEPIGYRQLNTSDIHHILEFTMSFSNEDPGVIKEHELQLNTILKPVRSVLTENWESLYLR